MCDFTATVPECRQRFLNYAIIVVDTYTKTFHMFIWKSVSLLQTSLTYFRACKPNLPHSYIPWRVAVANAKWHLIVSVAAVDWISWRLATTANYWPQAVKLSKPGKRDSYSWQFMPVACHRSNVQRPSRLASPAPQSSIVVALNTPAKPPQLSLAGRSACLTGGSADCWLSACHPGCLTQFPAIDTI